jgi:HD-like signal output (HDOD) protein
MKAQDERAAPAIGQATLDTALLLRELQHCGKSVETLSRELHTLRARIELLHRMLEPLRIAGHVKPAVEAAPAGSHDLQGGRGPGTLDCSVGPAPFTSTASRDSLNAGSPQRWTLSGQTASGSDDAPLQLSPSGTTAVAVPQHLEDWLSRFTPADLPVLDRTCGEIAVLRETQDEVDAQELASVIEIDPMMTLKLFAHVAQVRGRARASEPESVIGALLTLGVVPFFRAFEELHSIEAQLHHRPDALEGLNAVLERSHRAAKFALAFAVHRMDPDAALLHSAALLHDVAELLLWCSEPDLAIEIRRRLRSRPGLRSAEAQRLVLQVRLIEVQHALMYRWRMPSRLISVLDGQKADNQMQVRIVELSVRVARHTANGWKDPAIPDDLIEIGRLLQLSPENVRNLILNIDRD